MKCSHRDEDGDRCCKNATFTGDDDKHYCGVHIYQHSNNLAGVVEVDCSNTACSNKIWVNAARYYAQPLLPNYCQECCCNDDDFPFEANLTHGSMGAPVEGFSGEDRSVSGSDVDLSDLAPTI